MGFIRNQLFSRKSGVRHLVSLVLAVFVLAWTYAVMALGMEDLYWLREFYEDMSAPRDIPIFWGVIGTCIGMSALMGGLICLCGEKWMLRFFLRWFYALIGAIPIVNLLVPLIYQRRRRKQGREAFVPDAGLRSSLEWVTYHALVTHNTVLHPDGKLKFGIVRYVFVSTFKLIGGVFLLILALLVPALTPVGVLLGIALLAVVSLYSAEAAFWVGAGAAILTALILVLHPMIALTINKRQPKSVKAVPQPAPESAEDAEPEPAPEPEEDTQVPVEADSDPLARIGDRKELIEVTERGPAREIENRKEKEL